MLVESIEVRASLIADQALQEAKKIDLLKKNLEKPIIIPTYISWDESAIRTQVQGLHKDLKLKLTIDTTSVHRELESVNRHLDKKRQHTDDLNAYWRRNPLKPFGSAGELEQAVNQAFNRVKIKSPTYIISSQQIINLRVGNEFEQSVRRSAKELERATGVKSTAQKALDIGLSPLKFAVNLPINLIKTPFNLFQASVKEGFIGFFREAGVELSKGLKFSNFNRTFGINTNKLWAQFDKTFLEFDKFVAASLSELLRSGDPSKAIKVGYKYSKANKAFSTYGALKSIATAGEVNDDLLNDTGFTELVTKLKKQRIITIRDLAEDLKKSENKVNHLLATQLEKSTEIAPHLDSDITSFLKSNAKDVSKTRVLNSLRSTALQKIDSLLPENFTQDLNQFLYSFEPLLNFIGEIQKFRVLELSEQFKQKKLGQIPDLANHEEGYTFIGGGAMYRHGTGGEGIRERLEPLISNRQLIGLSNPETDPHGQPNSLVGKLLNSVLKRVMPDLYKDRDLGNTIANGLNLISKSIDPTAFSTSAAELVGAIKALEERGVDFKEISALFYSLGGSDAYQAAEALKEVDKQINILAASYPSVGLRSQHLPNFKAIMAEEDPLSFLDKLGIGRRQHFQSFATGSSYNINTHDLKHLFKSLEALDVIDLHLGTRLKDNGKSQSEILASSADFRDNLAQVVQLFSILKTGNLDNLTPLHNNVRDYNAAEFLEALGAGLAKSKSLKDTVNKPETNADEVQKYRAELAYSTFNHVFQALASRVPTLQKFAGKEEDSKSLLVYLGQAQKYNAALNAFRAIHEGKPLDEKTMDLQWVGGTNPSRDVAFTKIKDAIEGRKWFGGKGGNPLSGEYGNKVNTIFKDLERLTREYATTGNISKESLAKSKEMEIPEDFKPLLKELGDIVWKLGEGKKLEQVRDYKIPVPQFVKDEPEIVVAYNKIRKVLQDSIPDINEFERAARGMSGAIALLTKDLVYKTDLLDPEKVLSDNERKVYEHLGGRYAPRLVEGGVKGEGFAVERIQGRSVADILEKEQKPLRETESEIEKQKLKLRELKKLPKEEQSETDIQNIQDYLEALNTEFDTQKEEFNKKLLKYYYGIGRLLKTFHKLNVAHNDLASANVFVTPEGKFKGIDFGNAKYNPSGLDKQLDYNTTITRLLADTHQWGVLDHPKMIQAIARGYKKPFDLEVPKQPLIPRQSYENTEIPLGQDNETVFEHIAKKYGINLPRPNVERKKTQLDNSDTLETEGVVAITTPSESNLGKAANFATDGLSKLGRVVHELVHLLKNLSLEGGVRHQVATEKLLKGTGIPGRLAYKTAEAMLPLALLHGAGHLGVPGAELTASAIEGLINQISNAIGHGLHESITQGRLIPDVPKLPTTGNWFADFGINAKNMGIAAQNASHIPHNLPIEQFAKQVEQLASGLVAPLGLKVTGVDVFKVFSKRLGKILQVKNFAEFNPKDLGERESVLLEALISKHTAKPYDITTARAGDLKVFLQHLHKILETSDKPKTIEKALRDIDKISAEIKLRGIAINSKREANKAKKQDYDERRKSTLGKGLDIVESTQNYANLEKVEYSLIAARKNLKPSDASINKQISLKIQQLDEHIKQIDLELAKGKKAGEDQALKELKRDLSSRKSNYQNLANKTNQEVLLPSDSQGKVDFLSQKAKDIKTTVDKLNIYFNKLKTSGNLLSNKDQLLQYVQDLQSQSTGYLGLASQLRQEGSLGKKQPDSSLQSSIDKLKKLDKKLRDVGKDLGNGVSAGINVHSADTKMRELVDNSIEAAKQEGEIHSPSRKTEREIGMPLGQGVIKGIENSFSNLKSKVRFLLNELKDASKDFFSGDFNKEAINNLREEFKTPFYTTIKHDSPSDYTYDKKKQTIDLNNIEDYYKKYTQIVKNGNLEIVNLNSLVKENSKALVPVEISYYRINQKRLKEQKDLLGSNILTLPEGLQKTPTLPGKKNQLLLNPGAYLPDDFIKKVVEELKQGNSLIYQTGKIWGEKGLEGFRDAVEFSGQLVEPDFSVSTSQLLVESIKQNIDKVVKGLGISFEPLRAEFEKQFSEIFDGLDFKNFSNLSGEDKVYAIFDVLTTRAAKATNEILALGKALPVAFGSGLITIATFGLSKLTQNIALLTEEYSFLAERVRVLAPSAVPALNQTLGITKKLGYNPIETGNQFAGVVSELGDTNPENVKQVFAGLQKYARLQNLPNDNIQRAFLAIQQINNKQQVFSEELKQQLAEAVPGAYSITAKGLGITPKELQGRLAGGQVSAQEFLSTAGLAFEDKTKGSEKILTESLVSKLGQLDNQIQSLQIEAGKPFLQLNKDVVSLQTLSLAGLEEGLKIVNPLIESFIVGLKTIAVINAGIFVFSIIKSGQALVTLSNITLNAQANLGRLIALGNEVPLLSNAIGFLSKNFGLLAVAAITIKGLGFAYDFTFGKLNKNIDESSNKIEQFIKQQERLGNVKPKFRLEDIPGQVVNNVSKFIGENIKKARAFIGNGNVSEDPIVNALDFILKTSGISGVVKTIIPNASIASAKSFFEGNRIKNNDLDIRQSLDNSFSGGEKGLYNNIKLLKQYTEEITGLELQKTNLNIIGANPKDVNAITKRIEDLKKARSILVSKIPDEDDLQRQVENYSTLIEEKTKEYNAQDLEGYKQSGYNKDVIESLQKEITQLKSTKSLLEDKVALVKRIKEELANTLNIQGTMNALENQRTIVGQQADIQAIVEQTRLIDSKLNISNSEVALANSRIELNKSLANVQAIRDELAGLSALQKQATRPSLTEGIKGLLKTRQDPTTLSENDLIKAKERLNILQATPEQSQYVDLLIKIKQTQRELNQAQAQYNLDLAKTNRLQDELTSNINNVIARYEILKSILTQNRALRDSKLSSDLSIGDNSLSAFTSSNKLKDSIQDIRNIKDEIKDTLELLNNLDTKLKQELEGKLGSSLKDANLIKVKSLLANQSDSLAPEQKTALEQILRVNDLKTNLGEALNSQGQATRELFNTGISLRASARSFNRSIEDFKLEQENFQRELIRGYQDLVLNNKKAKVALENQILQNRTESTASRLDRAGLGFISDVIRGFTELEVIKKESELSIVEKQLQMQRSIEDLTLKIRQHSIQVRRSIEDFYDQRLSLNKLKEAAYEAANALKSVGKNLPYNPKNLNVSSIPKPDSIGNYTSYGNSSKLPTYNIPVFDSPKGLGGLKPISTGGEISLPSLPPVPQVTNYQPTPQLVRQVETPKTIYNTPGNVIDLGQGNLVKPTYNYGYQNEYASPTFGSEIGIPSNTLPPPPPSLDSLRGLTNSLLSNNNLVSQTNDLYKEGLEIERQTNQEKLRASGDKLDIKLEGVGVAISNLEKETLNARRSFIELDRSLFNSLGSFGDFADSLMNLTKAIEDYKQSLKETISSSALKISDYEKSRAEAEAKLGDIISRYGDNSNEAKFYRQFLDKSKEQYIQAKTIKVDAEKQLIEVDATGSRILAEKLASLMVSRKLDIQSKKLEIGDIINQTQDIKNPFGRTDQDRAIYQSKQEISQLEVERQKALLEIQNQRKALLEQINSLDKKDSKSEKDLADLNNLPQAYNDLASSLGLVNEKYDASIAKSEAQASTFNFLKKEIGGVVESNFASFLVDLGKNINNAGTVFRKFVSTVLEGIAQIFAKMASQSFMKLLSGNQGNGGLFGGLFGSIFGGGGSAGLAAFSEGMSPVLGFANGGMIDIPNYEDGGSVLPLLKGINTAIKKEGEGATVVVAKTREYILNREDTSHFLKLQASGMWNRIKSGNINFATGGYIGVSPQTQTAISNNSSRNNSTVNNTKTNSIVINYWQPQNGFGETQDQYQRKVELSTSKSRYGY